MCCFSQPVVSVSSTQIFARRASKTSQILVYSMKLAAKQDLAMILPVPVPAKTPESAVKFIDLTTYPDFFTDLGRGFPSSDPSLEAIGKTGAGGQKSLAVVDVGSFEASFVPTVKDFSRLDAKFRLPKAAWSALPQYAAFGFAVFKLKAKHAVFHPMAFEFPTTYASQLFFPTVHIHDGKVHDHAEFDHALYCQMEQIHNPGLEHWEESRVPVGMIMDYTRGAAVIERFTHVHRRKISGSHKNQDVIVG